MIGYYSLLGLYFGANAVALILFWIDKRAAQNDGWRTPESTLLFWAALGWFGAKRAQRVFRHKTRKQPFATRLNGAIVLHVVFWGAALAWTAGWVGTQDIEAILRLL
ncbi:MAG: DUF1294 domain-containing protein [Pseudomonadota bacterium]